MTTRVRVNAGICGFISTVTAEKGVGKKVRISIESECEMVKKLAEELSVLDMMSAFSAHLNNPVYRAASRHIRHVACPITSGILKALEAELGLCIPRDAGIVFLKDEE